MKPALLKTWKIWLNSRIYRYLSAGFKKSCNEFEELLCWFNVEDWVGGGVLVCKKIDWLLSFPSVIYLCCQLSCGLTSDIGLIFEVTPAANVKRILSFFINFDYKSNYIWVYKHIFKS